MFSLIFIYLSISYRRAVQSNLIHDIAQDLQNLLNVISQIGIE
jgi:hypothetical protein